MVRAPRVESRTISGVEPPAEALYACCKVTLLAFAVQDEIRFEPFRHRAVDPAEPSDATESVDENEPAPVTASVPPSEVAPVPTVKVLEPVTDVFPFNDTAPVPVEKVPDPVCEILPDVVIPVAPVIAPAPVIAIVGEVRKLSNPVPKVMPLKVLFV